MISTLKCKEPVLLEEIVTDFLDLGVDFHYIPNEHEKIAALLLKVVGSRGSILSLLSRLESIDFTTHLLKIRIDTLEIIPEDEEIPEGMYV